MLRTFEEYRHFAWSETEPLGKDPNEPFFNKKKKEYKRGFIWSKVDSMGGLTKYFKSINVKTIEDLTDEVFVDGVIDYINTKLIGETVKFMGFKVKGGKEKLPPYNVMVGKFTNYWITNVKECKRKTRNGSNNFISLFGEDGEEYIINVNVFLNHFFVKKFPSTLDHSDVDPFNEESWFD